MPDSQWVRGLMPRKRLRVSKVVDTAKITEMVHGLTMGPAEISDMEVEHCIDKMTVDPSYHTISTMTQIANGEKVLVVRFGSRIDNTFWP